MANKFRDISVDEYKKLSDEEQKNFKEVIKKTFLGLNKISMENQTEEARSKKRKKEALKKNFDVMSGIWKQSKITSTAIRVVSNNWGKILALAIFLLPKSFWTKLRETIYKIYDFFKGKSLSQVWSDLVDKNLGKVVAGIGILAAMFAPKATFMVAMAGFKTLMLGFKGMKWAGNKIIGGPQQQGPVRTVPAGTGTSTKTTTQIKADKAAREVAKNRMRQKGAAQGLKNVGKGAGWMSKMVPILGSAGRILGWVGVGIAAADAIGKGFFSENMKGKSFGDKITTTLAVFTESMTLGLVSAEWTKNLLDNIGKTIKDGVINGATAITKGIILGLDNVANYISDGLDFVRNFDWDREVKRIREARKDPAKEKKGEEADTNEILDILDGSGNVSVEQKARLKERMNKKAKAAGIETEVKVDTDEEQKERIRKEIEYLKKEKEKAQKKYSAQPANAKRLKNYTDASKNLKDKQSELKNFGVGPGNAPVTAMGANASSGHGLITTPSPITASKTSYPRIDDDGDTTNMDGVKWGKMHKSGRSGVEAAIWEIYNNHGKTPFFVSGLRDKKHHLYNPKSQHAYGLGFDLRSKGLGTSKDAIANDLHRVFNQKGWFMQEEIAGQSNTTGTKATGDHFHIHKAAKGFHGVVESATGFIAGEAGSERVDITPLNGPDAKLATFNNLQNQNLDAQRMGGSGGGTTIVAPTTNNNRSQATTAVLANPSAKDTFWEKT